MVSYAPRGAKSVLRVALRVAHRGAPRGTPLELLYRRLLILRRSELLRPLIRDLLF